MQGVAREALAVHRLIEVLEEEKIQVCHKVSADSHPHDQPLTLKHILLELLDNSWGRALFYKVGHGVRYG